jgi:putative sterol carrier protein
MGLKYLSEEYIKEVNNKIQSDEGVQNAAKGQTIAIQQVTTDVPDLGEVKGYLKIADGNPEVGPGEVENPEATVTQNYETSVAISKGELNTQQAFMQGKIKIQGNLMKLMPLQPFFNAMGNATKDIETDY